MILRNSTSIAAFVLGCAGLLACKQSGRTSECLSTASKSLPIAEQSSYVQGGYIHFGDKACSAMFEIQDVNSENIRLKGYSARHCRFENGLSLDKVSVSLHIDGTASRASGYIKNIRAEESFVTRASGAMAEVNKLNSPDATGRFLSALKIPTQYDPWGGEIFSDGGETGSSSLICNNFDQIRPVEDASDQLTDSCWSFLDIGTYDLVLNKRSFANRDYELATSQLIAKQKGLDQFLARRGSLRGMMVEQRKQIDSIIGLLRVQKAAPLAYLLNFDLCKAPTRHDALCAQQPALIDIMGRHFVEVDDSGSRKNIFDRIATTKGPEGSNFVAGLSWADLRAGKRLPLEKQPANFSELESLAQVFASEFLSHLKDRTAVAIIRMKDMIAEQSKPADIDSLSPALVVATNFSASANRGSAMRFALFAAEHIASDRSKIRLGPPDLGASARTVHGVGQYGTLRLAMPRESQVVQFQPTDSGSLLTLAGVVPLMVLNTVDGVGTSGGSAILALPELADEDEAGGPVSSARRGNDAAKPVSQKDNSGKATNVRVSSTSFGGVQTACR